MKVEVGKATFPNVFVSSLYFIKLKRKLHLIYFYFFLDVDCRNPPPIVNGIVTLSTNATYYGATALYECNENFKLDGVSRRLCSEDGSWGHESPLCVEITCPQFNVSEYLVASDGKRLVGEIAKFTCKKGTTLIGNDTRTCLPNGRWSGKYPVCKRKYN
jgi:hypothetical protein